MPRLVATSTQQSPTSYARTPERCFHSQTYPCAGRKWLGQPCRTPLFGAAPNLQPGRRGVAALSYAGPRDVLPVGPGVAPTFLHLPRNATACRAARTTYHILHCCGVTRQRVQYAVRLGTCGVAGYGHMCVDFSVSFLLTSHAWSSGIILALVRELPGSIPRLPQHLDVSLPVAHPPGEVSGIHRAVVLVCPRERKYPPSIACCPRIGRAKTIGAKTNAVSLLHRSSYPFFPRLLFRALFCRITLTFLFY